MLSKEVLRDSGSTGLTFVLLETEVLVDVCVDVTWVLRTSSPASTRPAEPWLGPCRVVSPVAVSMTGGFFEAYACAVDAFSSYADSTITRVDLMKNVERGYGETTRKSRS